MKKAFLMGLLLCVTVTYFSVIKVSVSIVPQKTFVEAVGKEKVNVMVIIPPGNSPANYAPTARQIIDFSRSRVYFTIGVPTEASNILPKMAKNAPEVHVIHLEKRVDSVYQPRTFARDKRDPHIWLSPKRVIIMIQSIRDFLSSEDPQNSNYYEANAQEYIAELQRIDTDLKKQFSTIENKGFFCYHPAFGYFADDYDLIMHPLEAEGKDATAKRLAELVDLAKKESIKVIFYQAEIDSSQTLSFANEIGGKALKLDPLSAEYIDNLTNMGHIFAEVFQNDDG